LDISSNSQIVQIPVPEYNLPNTSNSFNTSSTGIVENEMISNQLETTTDGVNINNSSNIDVNSSSTNADILTRLKEGLPAG
jgi:hypothetical protein